MGTRGVVIAFSGQMGSGTSVLSRLVADRLGWPQARFSEYIRRYAAERGDDPNDRGVLQRLGQKLVTDHLEAFVGEVLRLGRWPEGVNLVLDGLRHAEVVVELRRQLGDRADLHVVHVNMLDSLRLDRTKASEGLDALSFAHYAADLTEAQLERVLPAYAEVVLEGDASPDSLVKLILARFGFPDRPPDDDGEAITTMEPMRLAQESKHTADLANLAAELLSESVAFTAALPPGIRTPLADLVRAMNCYYSNLIEGHETSPYEIDRALHQDYNTDSEKRDLQREAKAHIATQLWIDQGGLGAWAPSSQAALVETHRRFCSELPSSMLWVTNTDTKERWRLRPGQYRNQRVRVGRLVPPSPGAVPRFMTRFEERYGNLRKMDLILAAAAAHHRLLWIHPFADGNGRVARLMSHAMFLDALNSHGLWSVARGLARAKDTYKGHLAACDLERRNALDGRGALSEEALAAFTRFFLDRCLDQVRFMRALTRPEELRNRWSLWVNEQAQLGRLPRSASRVVHALLAEGDLRLEDAADLLGVEVLEARGVLMRLEEEGVAVGTFVQGRYALGLPIKLAERITPGLFP